MNFTKGVSIIALIVILGSVGLVVKVHFVPTVFAEGTFVMEPNGQKSECFTFTSARKLQVDASANTDFLLAVIENNLVNTAALLYTGKDDSYRRSRLKNGSITGGFNPRHVKGVLKLNVKENQGICVVYISNGRETTITRNISTLPD
jgi:hypothetical protein